MKQLLQNRNVVICFVLMLFLYFPLFLHLQKESVFLWDESRLAWNAIEMSKNNNFIVTYFEGKPDLWNTKPPLLVALQALNIKVLGVNELALRLPSAIAAFITCIVLFYFLKKQTNQMWLGFFAAMILVTSQGYVNYHCSRTGDYDSLLILFTTLFCLSFFNYLHTK
ncbi:MAG TPA: glycosyltransferase family 39 protein, partial [Bacteroidia bacterium]|nr:glycosyltransferase family 39 protein [Bacteroidia bacterium]